MIVDINKAFLQELDSATKYVLNQYKLGGSDLSSSIEWGYRDNVFVMVANDYFRYVSTGRRARARKIPVEDIIKWMKKKGIAPKNGDYNASAYAIVESIYKTGIKAKNYINPITEVNSELISEELAEALSEAIANEIAQDLTLTLGKGSK